MKNYMEDYIEILDNDKEYKEVISILCQRRIRERLRNAITEIVENKRYLKFNDVKLSKLDFDVIGKMKNYMYKASTKSHILNILLCMEITTQRTHSINLKYL